LFIPVILGTAREGRPSEKAARFMLQKALDAGLESEVLDVRDYLWEDRSTVRQRGFSQS